MHDLRGAALGPGSVLRAVRREGLGGVVRCIAHSGAQVWMRTERACHLAAPRASVLWFARYTASVVANGWEPYDQPNPVTYMPHGYSAFEQVPIEGGDALLIQRHCDHGAIRIGIAIPREDGMLLFVPAEDPEGLAHALDLALSWIGVPPDRISQLQSDLIIRISKPPAEAAA